MKTKKRIFLLSVAGVVVIALAAATLVLLIQRAPAARIQVRFESSPCRFEVPEAERIECGDLVVPENRATAASPELRLHVAQVRSHSATPAPDPIVFLEGGPGAHALDALVFTLENYKGLLAQRDLIFFDQRGVGHSQPSLDCPELDDTYLRLLNTPLSWRDHQAQEALVLAGCAERLRSAGRDLSAYNSLASAADLEALRQALGYDKWNLLAASYGTRLALTTMREYPEGIRSVVLDSPVPLQVDPYLEMSMSFQNALNLLFERCALDPQCARSFSDLAQRFERLIGQLTAEPLHTTVFDLRNGQALDAIIDGDKLILFTRAALYESGLIPLLPRIITDLERGVVHRDMHNWIAQQLILPLYVSEGMGYSVRCTEEAPFSSPTAETASTEGLASWLQDHHTVVLDTGRVVCAAWNTQPAPAIENEPVVSAIPTLLLAGDYDPVTPPAWARQAAATLSASQTIEFPGVGHSVFFARQCARTIVQSFFAEPESAVDITCLASMKPYFLQR